MRRELQELRVTLDLKTLNHRSLDIRFHSPRALSLLEISARECVQASLHRGRVEIFLRGEASQDGGGAITANPALARTYVDALARITRAVPGIGQPRLDQILALPGVFEVEDPEVDCEAVRGPVMELLDEAVTQVVTMRTDEGSNLSSELRRILEHIRDVSDSVKELAPQVQLLCRERILERIAEWKLAKDLDEQRIAQEVALQADRADIREETTRLSSHIGQFLGFLEENGEGPDYTPVGRRLDFLCQEMFREVNTMGAKSQDIKITKLVLELKSNVERLREQVQNVE